MHSEALLRSLIHAQTLDEAWITNVANAIDLYPTMLTIDYWNKTFLPSERGSVKEINILEEQGIIWNRPDFGMPMAITDPTPRFITLTRFYMYSQIIKILKASGQLSFAKVGYPKEWNRVTINFNGRIIDNVISADALLGIAEFNRKDSQGNYVVNEKGDEILTIRVAGTVKIFVNEKPQTFF